MLRRPKNRLIYDLLHGCAGAPDDVIAEARDAGIDLTQPRAVMLIDASDYAFATETGALDESLAGGPKARTQEVVRMVVSFFKLPKDSICATIGDGQVVVLKASNSRNLVGWAGSASADSIGASWANLGALKRAADDLLGRLIAHTRSSMSIGIGRYHPGVAGIADSYQDARAALALGRRVNGPNRAHCLDELGIAAFVAIDNERMKRDLARHLLSPLDREPELLDTLDRFFANDCSPAATAAELGIHRNTLAYRLNKIASMTGLDARRFDEAVQIRLARVLRELAVATVP